MQFSGTFQLFTKTISMAWQALIWTSVVTIIFIIAIALATVTINGNNIKIFRDLPKGIVTVTSFAFGYNHVMSPLDLSFGGEFLGIILYVIMGFVVKYLLINLIISMMRAVFKYKNIFLRIKKIKSRHRKFNLQLFF